MTNNINIPDLKTVKTKIFSELERSNLLKELRNKYIRIIMENKLTHCDNITNLDSWLCYLYYCKMIENICPSKNTCIIDWGGLYGHVTEILRTMGYNNIKNYLLHVSPSYKLFKDQFGIPSIYGKDPNRLNLADNSVDIFISSGVLEHVREDGVGREETILGEINRVLNPEGLFFIWNLPTMLGSSEILASLFKKWHHKFRYSKKKIIALLKTAQFEVAYLEKNHFFPGAITRTLTRKINPVTLFKFDDYLSQRFPFNIVANNFGIIAKKTWKKR